MAIDAALVRSPSSISTGNVIHAGASGGSSFPTMTALNNGTYTEWNQVIGLYNRRTNQAMVTPDTVSYVSAGTSFTASFHNALRTKIDTLRTNFGLSGYSWNQTISAGTTQMKAADINDCYAALNFSSAKSLTSSMASGVYGGFAISQTYEKPRGTFVSRIDDASGVFGSFAGNDSNEIGTPAVDSYYRNRIGFGFAFPNWTNLNGATGTMIMAMSTWINGLSTWAPYCYQSSGNYTSLPANWASHTDTAIGSATYNSSPGPIWFIPAATVKANYGTTKSYIISSDGEFTNSTPSATAGTANINAMYPSAAATLTFDLGF